MPRGESEGLELDMARTGTLMGFLVGSLLLSSIRRLKQEAVD
jgi:hypothetical protein